MVDVMIKHSQFPRSFCVFEFGPMKTMKGLRLTVSYKCNPDYRATDKLHRDGATSQSQYESAIYKVVVTFTVYGARLLVGRIEHINRRAGLSLDVDAAGCPYRPQRWPTTAVKLIVTLCQLRYLALTEAQ